jgi:hypothetical protein
MLAAARLSGDPDEAAAAAAAGADAAPGGDGTHRLRGRPGVARSIRRGAARRRGQGRGQA